MDSLLSAGSRCIEELRERALSAKVDRNRFVGQLADRFGQIDSWPKAMTGGAVLYRQCL